MLPIDLVLVRHGQSEANIFNQGLEINGKVVNIPEEFGSRHDSNMRLSKLGSSQARAAGDWLRANGLGKFESFNVSPHTRTRETAGHLHLNGSWMVDDRWRERDWGELAGLRRDEQEERHADSLRLRSLNEWYWKPLAGESLATGVRARFKSIMDSMYRKKDVHSAIGVTHGELIRVAQFEIERMSPDQWLRMDGNPEYKVHNCMIVHYSRRNPETGETGSNYLWRRGVCPWDESLSWDNGEWQRIEVKVHSDEELLRSAQEYPRLLDISD